MEARAGCGGVVAIRATISPNWSHADCMFILVGNRFAPCTSGIDWDIVMRAEWGTSHSMPRVGRMGDASIWPKLVKGHLQQTKYRAPCKLLMRDFYCAAHSRVPKRVALIRTGANFTRVKSLSYREVAKWGYGVSILVRESNIYA